MNTDSASMKSHQVLKPLPDVLSGVDVSKQVLMEQVEKFSPCHKREFFHYVEHYYTNFQARFCQI